MVKLYRYPEFQTFKANQIHAFTTRNYYVIGHLEENKTKTDARAEKEKNRKKIDRIKENVILHQGIQLFKLYGPKLYSKYL